ncbi:peroxidasin homolog pxn-1-like [Diadema antillarum]|uniref:peroxidasin homolog pxn-1-like n=2 Tax=Diadema antillarum TaxID=105358 RepID=UPI003A879921
MERTRFLVGVPPEVQQDIFEEFHVAEGACDTEDNELYRRIDGACNNKANPEWGKSSWPLRRLANNSYVDNVYKPVAGLPNPREVSVEFRAVENDFQGPDPDPSGTMLLAIMGQFIDHDIALVPLFNESCDNCSSDSASFTCSPIKIAQDDPFYQGHDLCMEVPRSLGVPGWLADRDSTEGSREHVNDITSYLDGSQIYGSTYKHARELRTKLSECTYSAKLRTFDPSTNVAYKGPDGLKPQLPHDTHNTMCADKIDGLCDCGLGGDERAAEQPVLTALHTIFVRFHNDIADQLEKLNGHAWTEEKIYNESRKIAVGIWQHIVYNEYLPALLGPAVAHLKQLEIKPAGVPVPAYDPELDATISNVFAAAAFRLGHSQIPSLLERRANDNSQLEPLPLHLAFFNALPVYDHAKNGVNGLLLGNIAQRLNKIDRHFANAITGNLFFERESGFGLDLLAINIQRAREHGLQPYAVYRELCSPNETITSWEDLAKLFSDKSVFDKLIKIYGKDGFRDVDPFVGFMSEEHVPGGRVGHTLACLIGEQFRRFRLGDRFWYETASPAGFTEEQLKAIKSMTMSRVLCDTLDNPEELSIQPYAFMMADPHETKFYNEKPWAQYSMEVDFPTADGLKLPKFSNHRVSCSDTTQIPDLNLDAWKINVIDPSGTPSADKESGSSSSGSD